MLKPLSIKQVAELIVNEHVSNGDYACSAEQLKIMDRVSTDCIIRIIKRIKGLNNQGRL